MAKVKNITKDVLSLFRADAPPIQPGDEVTVRDENFVDRAWPTSTWEVVEPPDPSAYHDLSSDEAALFSANLPDLPEDAYPEDATPLPEVEPTKPRTRAKKED